MMKDSEFTWQRARSPDQISQRIGTVLDAAGDLFSELPYETVTMQRIAERANFTRSNLYRYFRSREEIFLTLYRIDIGVWANEVLASFNEFHSVSISSFVSRWTDIMLRHNRLLRLTPLLSLSLENNVPEEPYRDFKTYLGNEMISVIPILKNALPGLTDNQWSDFLLLHAALVAGMWPMSRYSDMQHSVLSSPDLSWMKIDFGAFIRKSLAAYLRGISPDQSETS